MSRIRSIHIHNFKFFDRQDAIDLNKDGKHLLLFGENGSGKSSVYWALYTLFKASLKDKPDIEKHFKHADDHEESLINIHAHGMSDLLTRKKHYDSFIKVRTTDNPPKDYEVSLLNTNISRDAAATEINQASDFLNYKVLYKFQDFRNGQPIDLAKIFEGYILPYLSFTSFDLYRNGAKVSRSNASEMWEEIKKGPGTTTNAKGNTIQVYKYSNENKQFDKFAKHFDDQFKDLIDFINVNAPFMLKKLGYDIDFELKYHEHTHRKRARNFDWTSFKIDLKITSYLGKAVNIHRPQSFLNEAKLAAIAIAIRLTILRKRINEQAPNVMKFIVLDDVMISLDMNNRDKLIDFLLDKTNKFTEDYQLLFLTHDKNLFDFVAHKIKKWDNQKNWVFKEMYAGKDEQTKKEYPIIIDSDLEFINSAKKYFEAKDYTACSIFLRKELEKIVNQRLPPELKYKSDGTFLSLQTLWGNMVNRYNALGKPIDEDIKKCFEESKLMVLNPQAHFQHISMPIYKIELEKAFQLIEDINTKFPIPQFTILLTKGMKLQFRHPTENYTFDFETLSDFYFDELAGANVITYPKCAVSIWQYKGTDFLSPSQGTILTAAQITTLHKRKDDTLIDVLSNLKKDTLLNITNEMFVENTTIDNSIWSMKEVLDKAQITL